jgi:hypothetical protein
MDELAQERPRWSWRRLIILVRRDGFIVGERAFRRIYCARALQSRGPAQTARALHSRHVDRARDVAERTLVGRLCPRSVGDGADVPRHGRRRRLHARRPCSQLPVSFASQDVIRRARRAGGGAWLSQDDPIRPRRRIYKPSDVVMGSRSRRRPPLDPAGKGDSDRTRGVVQRSRSGRVPQSAQLRDVARGTIILVARGEAGFQSRSRILGISAGESSAISRSKSPSGSILALLRTYCLRSGISIWQLVAL